jgi:hypothetical protein
MLAGGSDIVNMIVAYNGGQHFDYTGMSLHSSVITIHLRKNILHSPLTHIFDR